MFCSDVGLAFICCEREQTAEEKIERAQEIMSVKKTVKRRKMTTTAEPPSNGLIMNKIEGRKEIYRMPRRVNRSSRPVWISQEVYS